ncbi:SLBB domain-containing protein [Aquirufa aurantiipilula]|uniref:SLBB domain-containing protein n=1 Tax=Aquirufa aurantiipilula TaxID=2696561 RepID=A0ABT6BM40_9BACT|nr:SLBB domain-containing protein [Aquirufa aurantiipilula]MDF5691546.1 SLBB domain-containing protein [Aquirufa aurantiipilula]
MSQKNLSAVKASQLSDAEIQKIKSQIESSSLSLDDLKKTAQERGLPSEEFDLIRQRIEGQKNSTQQNSNEKSPDISMKTDVPSPKNNPDIDPLIFGSELFMQTSNFMANSNLASPYNYEIGPNDVLKIMLYGIQEFTTEQRVTKEGNITIPNIGLVKISGLTLEAAQSRIKQQMEKTIYKSLKTNESKLSVTLSNIRTIHITIIGAKNSGTFNVSSLTTVFNALNIAGGPSKIGTYRNIELIRNNKLLRTIDLYHFLINGDQSDNVGLKENDVIRIPPFKDRIEIKGFVKRPGMFETKAQETFADMLNYSGGFDDFAYQASIQVIKKTDEEFQIKDLPKNEFSSFHPEGGSTFIVSKILNRYKNRIKIGGAVFRPESYELKDGLRIKNLIEKSGGLKEDAYLFGAHLFRNKVDLTKEIININLKKVLEGDSKENILLQREDSIHITSIFDLKDKLKVSVQGEVHKPGSFTYFEGITIKDLIRLAGGTTYRANSKIEIARSLNKGVVSSDNSIESKTQILYSEIDVNLNVVEGFENYQLEPFDYISITKNQNFNDVEQVKLSGQIRFTGTYSLSSKTERISDLIQRSGGILPSAFLKGAYLIRSGNKKNYLEIDNSDSHLDSLESIKNNAIIKLPDGSIQQKSTKKVDYLALELDKILDKPGSTFDIILKDGDELIVPKFNNQVSISGAVFQETTIPFENGLNIRKCISSAGGVTEKSLRGKAYVIYANGRSKQIKRFGFFRFNPVIEPGCQVVVPVQTQPRTNVLVSILQYTGMIAQIGTTLLTISLLSK